MPTYLASLSQFPATPLCPFVRLASVDTGMVTLRITQVRSPVASNDVFARTQQKSTVLQVSLYLTPNKLRGNEDLFPTPCPKLSAQCLVKRSD